MTSAVESPTRTGTMTEIRSFEGTGFSFWGRHHRATPGIRCLQWRQRRRIDRGRQLLSKQERMLANDGRPVGRDVIGFRELRSDRTDNLRHVCVDLRPVLEPDL